MKLIDEHFKWMESGFLPYIMGICYSLEDTVYEKYLILFHPTMEECDELFWGRDSDYEDHFAFQEKYNTFRQTIVLFICAMHNEL